jgi:sugar diacid utilization regulator
VVTVGALLHVPGLAGALRLVAPTGLDREVRSVIAVEHLQGLDAAAPQSLAIVLEAASREARGYRLDMALRRAASREMAGLIFTGEEPRLGRTAADLALRSGLALLHLADGPGLADVITAIQQELAGGLDQLVARAQACLVAIEEGEVRRSSLAELVESVRQALGSELRLGEVATGWLSVPILGADSALAVSTPGEGGATDTIRRLVLHRLAAAAERLERARHRATEAPIQTRAELLTELLAREPEASRDLVRRARQLSIPIDGWHAVVRLELENLAELRPDDEVWTYEVTQLAARLATDTARASGGTWNRAGTGSVVLLIRSWQAEAGHQLQADVARIAEAVIGRIRARIPRLSVRCGVGGVHVGATGLRTSALEARAAVAAALASDRRNVPVRFDSTGLRRVLLQWYALDDARELATRLLEPLDRLGERQGREAVRTLRAYLDGHCSISRAAQTLGLHRNTVGYRIGRILDLLDVDLDDPEQRLMLQLACRAREL